MSRPRSEYVDEVTKRRRARQRAYYYANRDERVAYARQRYLENKPRLTDLEIAEAERLKAQRSAEVATRKRKRHAKKRADKVTRQRRWLNRLKLRRGCVDCGYNAWPSALHFDHRPGEVKAFEIGGAVHYAWDTIMAEVAKCDVRCANCHHKVTDLRRRGVGVDPRENAAGEG